VSWIEPVRDRLRVDPVDLARRLQKARDEPEREAADERGRQERREEPGDGRDDGMPHVDVLA